MTNKFSKMGMDSTGNTGAVPDKEEKPFERDESDNKLFPEIQVNDIRPLITEDCVGVKDSDTMLFKAAQNVERKFVKVTNLKTNKEHVVDKITDFWGRDKTIKEGSILHELNVDRELLEEPLWTKEDFKVEQCQELKYDTEEEALEKAKIQVNKVLRKERLQYRIPKILMVIGEGDNFRNKIPLCRPYKGERKEQLRPLVLKKLREWAVKERGAIVAKPRWDGEMVEADDVCEYYGSLGYKHYRKTGKFSYLVLASDKDAGGNPKLWVNPDTYTGENNPLQGKFKMPQAMLVEASDRTVGGIEKSFNTKGDLQGLKGYGFVWIMYQAILGKDSADCYDALGHLKDSGYNLNFGDESAYAVLKPCKTAKEALQKSLDTVVKLLPYGVKYKDFKGNKYDVDTLTYLNNYFLTAYMMRHDKDNTDLFKLCKMFKVDTSKIENNNTRTAPYKVFDLDKAEHLLNKVFDCNESILKEELKSYKSLKKDLVVERCDLTKDKLEALNSILEQDMYKLVQRDKQTGEIIPVEEEKE